MTCRGAGMPNKRALVVYDSKYGSTEQVANWIAEGIDDAEIQHVEDVTSLFYDLIVIGSPVYNNAPTGGMVQFMEKNADTLKNRKLALFTVSVPIGMTPERAKRFMGAGELNALTSRVHGNVIAQKAFLGKLDLKEMTELDRLSMRIAYFIKGYKLKEINYLNREDAVSWGKKLYEMLTAMPEPAAKHASPESSSSTRVDK